MYGILLRSTFSCYHEQAVPLYSWRIESRATHFGGPEIRKLSILFYYGLFANCV